MDESYHDVQCIEIKEEPTEVKECRRAGDFEMIFLSDSAGIVKLLQDAKQRQCSEYNLTFENSDVDPLCQSDEETVKSSASTNRTEDTQFAARKLKNKKCLWRMCHYCNKEFTDKADFYKHIRIHAVKKLNPLVCGMCGKSFKTKLQFKRHICASNEFICKVCSKRCDSLFRLEAHVITHSNKCPYCKRIFQDITKCEMHLFACPSNGYGLTTPPSGVPVFIG